ncbi:hypothetical protein SNEBB_002929, partial [Seison nebaliae]
MANIYFDEDVDMDSLNSLNVDNFHLQFSDEVRYNDDEDENSIPSEIKPEKLILHLSSNLPYNKEKIAEIQDWYYGAKNIALDHDMDWFRCSDYFLNKWKGEYRVASRKITRFQKKTLQNNQIELSKEIEEYRNPINNR